MIRNMIGKCEEREREREKGKWNDEKICENTWKGKEGKEGKWKDREM